jgi:hypothetical protein
VLRDRLLGGLVAVGSIAMLATGASLTPDHAGHGTHTQLGMPACGWAIAFDRPCPTCGMTTAVSQLAHLDPLGSLATQPMGMLIGAGAAVAFWAGLHAGLFGVRLAPITRPLTGARAWWLIGGLVVAAWVYKLLTWTG